ncbi:hypothetical protein TeGR_g12320, partial [Tetraparma gracilis]
MTSFMDAWWQLSSPDASLRSSSGKAIVSHTFPPSSPPPLADQRYALARLLKGVCSGRGSSRQGFAAVLAVFLSRLAELPEDEQRAILDPKAAGPDEPTEGGPDEPTGGGPEEDAPPLRILLSRIVSHTVAPAGSKGSDSRDAQFGRLFALLAVGRSSLLSSAPAAEAAPFVKAALALFGEKRWMRETAAQAAAALHASLGEEARAAVLESTLRPFLARNPPAGCVDCLALQLRLEPAALTPALLLSSLPLLSATTAAFPRLHSVWPALLPLLPPPLLATLSERLLEPLASSTHERKALPLLLLPLLLSLPSATAEHARALLSQPVARLLLNAGSKDTKNPHTLQPLAESCLASLKPLLLAAPPSLRLAVASALLRADAKFDAKTRTDTVAACLGSLGEEGRLEYVDFLVGEALAAAAAAAEPVAEGVDGEEAERKLALRCGNAADALLAAARMFLPRGQRPGDGEAREEEERLTPVVGRIHAFLMAGAFFDCGAVEAPGPKAEKKKGKKGKKAPAPPPPP